MLPVFLAACQRDTALLEQQLQQQQERQHRRQQEQQQQQSRHHSGKKQTAKRQQQQQQLDVAAVFRIHMFLHTLASLRQCCNEQLVLGPVAREAEAAVRLGWAILQLEAVKNSNVASSSSSSSSSSRATSAETQLFEDTWKAAVVVADRLAGIFAFRIAADRPASMQHALPRLQDSTADKAVHSLLLYELAACAAALYAAAEQHNEQQDRPEPHHMQLLQQLGLVALEFKADGGMQKNRAMYAMHHIKTASMEISSALNDAATGGTTGSSSSSSRVGEGTVEVQPPPAEAAARADCRNSSSPLEEAAMLTLMQCTLLPPPGAEAAWFQHAVHLLGCFMNVLGASAHVAAAAVMLQPFVTQLLPAGLSALKAAAAAAAATTPASSSSRNAVPAAAVLLLEQQYSHKPAVQL
jgi:hypothetical protein